MNKASKMDNMAKGIANENAKEMKIEVKGTAPTDINLTVAGSSSNESSDNGVWEKVLTGKDAQKDWMIMATPKLDVNNPTPDNYQVECSITVDGKQVSHKSATGSAANECAWLLTQLLSKKLCKQTYKNKNPDEIYAPGFFSLFRIILFHCQFYQQLSYQSCLQGYLWNRR